MQKTFKLITGAGNADKTAEMLRKAEGELENYTRLAAFEAKRLKALYDSYIEAGFNEDQALNLIKK